MIKHKVTQEDLENNPELIEEGVKVGDMIEFFEDYNEESFGLILDILQDTTHDDALEVLDAVRDYIINEKGQLN